MKELKQAFGTVKKDSIRIIFCDKCGTRFVVEANYTELFGTMEPQYASIHLFNLLSISAEVRRLHYGK